MQKTWKVIVYLCWALWFGGLITLFITVITLFSFDHNLAAVAAPQVFHSFETYQLALACITILAARLWRKKGLAALFSLAAIGAVISPLVVTPKIMALARLGQTHTDHFAVLHGTSMLIYTADSVVLLAVGLILANKSSQ